MRRIKSFTQMFESLISNDSDEYEDIKWILIDFIDEGFGLRVYRYGNDLEIAMNNSISVSDIKMGDIWGYLENGQIKNKKSHQGIMKYTNDFDGKDKEWVENLETICLRLLDLGEYQKLSYSISKTLIPSLSYIAGGLYSSATHFSVNIHISLE